MEVGQYRGVQYGVPWTVAPIAMISNTQILKDSGVDFEVKTMADFEKACEMVLKNHPANTDSNKGNDVIPFAAMTKDSGTAAPDYLVWLWTFGGEVFDADGNCTLDTDESIEALKWFKSLKDKGYIQEAMGRGDARILFKEGRVAFYNDALGAKGAIKNEKFGSIEDYVLPICNPVINEGDLPQANAWGHLLVIIKKSPKSADAKTFIEYLLSDEVALKYFDVTGQLPSTNSVLASDAITSDYWSNSWTPILQNARLTELVGMNAAAYKSIITEELQSLLSGNKTPEEVAKTMKSRIDNI
jgi:multiple sugar transport system substrate-binding protein